MFFFVLPERSKAAFKFLSCIGTYHGDKLKTSWYVPFLICATMKLTKPGSGGTLTGPLTKPLIEVTVMADQQHTQTHPKFTWLFLATPKSHPDCSPVVLRFDTDTEENARAAFPGWEMVFAAKIRAEAPCRVAFFDYNTRRGWAFDSASDREVVGHD
ncbi:TPA: host cell division inhibitor Icd-like protein [Raoultella planticola]